MRFSETPLTGAYVIDLEPIRDDRGFFARTFCAREFEAHGLKPDFVQANLSHNVTRGTLRGLHFQRDPAPETKLVRCTKGALFDVIVDLRKDSPTRLQSFGVELSADNRRALFVPEYFAHGFLTLEDDTEAQYLVGEFYTPGVEGGLRYNDPALAINWPADVAVISEKDAAWPLIADGSEVLA